MDLTLWILVLVLFVIQFLLLFGLIGVILYNERYLRRMEKIQDLMWDRISDKIQEVKIQILEERLRNEFYMEYDGMVPASPA